jgi:formate--tetrahydrofolate ligase
MGTAARDNLRRQPRLETRDPKPPMSDPQPFPSDLEIARATELRPLAEVAGRYGLDPGDLVPYGRHQAKVDHRLGAPGGPQPARNVPARYVLVSAITPTPAGEGKTVHTIGTALALERLGHKAVCVIRQPSMGPVFGIKGGAAGGGYSQVVPMEDFNLHLTGDFHAVAAANNLLAAAVDTSMLLDNPLKIDPFQVNWKRVVDVNDRALRAITVGQGGPKNGIPRETGFDITSASEVMAVLGLSSDLADMRARLGRIIIGDNLAGKPVTADDLECAGAMAAILRDAIDPTILQTTEGTLAFVHTGPFANIAHGNSSIIADRVAARFADYVVTEAGFGADMGAEKFFNIKCRVSGMKPDVVVLVATVRALKSHSGHFPLRQGRPLPPELFEPNLEALGEGCSNLEAQIDNILVHGVPVVVAINRFPTDSDDELKLVAERALAAGAEAAEVSEVHAKGGAGGEALAASVVRVAESGKADFRPLYADAAGLREKIETLAVRLYGAGSVEFSPLAAAQLDKLTERGFGHLPICMAKTQYSLSHDPQFKGRPKGFVFPVRELRLAAGAGFVVAYSGNIMTMPGLGRKPAYKGVDLDAEGRIQGLF